MVSVFDMVLKTAIITLVTLNLTPKKYYYVQLELLQKQITFYPDHLKSVQENEAKKFCFALTLWPQPRSRSVKDLYTMVEVNGAYKRSRNVKNWWESLRLMSYIKLFAKQDATLTQLII